MIRREQILELTPEFIIESCKKKSGQGRMVTVVENALPDDATLVRVGVSEHGWLNLVVSSESFVEVLPGQFCRRLPSPVFNIDYSDDVWRPIDTYEPDTHPADVIVAVDNDQAVQSVGEARWHGAEGWWWAGNYPSDAHGSRIYPTHWRRLPERPVR